MKLMLLFPALGLALLVPIMTYSAPPPTGSILVSGNNSIWRAFATGQAERLPIISDSAPLISSDQRKIAFTRTQDVWLFDVETGDKAQITFVGMPQSFGLASVYAEPLSWSFLGRLLLFRVAHGTTERKTRRAPYGLKVYDLAKKKSEPFQIPKGKELAFWLPNGDWVLSDPSPYSQLIQVRRGENNGRPLSPLKGWFSHCNLSPGGTRVIASVGVPQPGKPDTLDQIFIIDLATGRESPVTEPGKKGEFHSPSFSPSGKRVAYLKTDSQPEPGIILKTLIIDSRRVYSKAQIASYHWIDDDSIALVLHQDLPEQYLVVLDANTGKERSRTAISP